MAEGLVEGSKNPEDATPSSASLVEPLFQKRIEFHPARKPYSPVSSAGGDFHLETLNPSSGPHRPAASLGGPTSAVAATPGKRSEGGEFYEHGLDPELSFRITFRRIGAGLANLGNTCFLNSVLQCLTYTEPFAAYLQSGRHKSSCRTAGFCAMCALQNHVMNALKSTGKILSPSHLVKNLRCISRNFRNSRQEDAHEYMVNLLESMHRCCLPSGVPSESPSAYEKSLVHKIFGGRLRSQVKCMQCSYCSNKFDPFLDLSLEIVKADSLSKALRHFTAVEQLDGGERQYQCQRCKEKVRALKQLTVQKPPHVLTIHLKRFGPDIPGEKIDKKVEFGPSLDLRPFVSDPHEPDLKYTLYGVLVHAGWSTHSGHYYCYVRTSCGMWHSLDDNRVVPVSEKTVLGQKAYMLFYVRDRTSAIKRSVDVAHKENIPANVLGYKVTPQSALVLNGSIRNSMVERKLSTSECSLATSKADDSSHARSSPLISTSSEQLLQNEGSFQKNGSSIPREAPPLQTNVHVTLQEASWLPVNGDVLPKGLEQTTPLEDPTVLPSSKNPSRMSPLAVTSNGNLMEDAHQDDLKDNGITTFTSENTQISHGKSQLPNSCNGKVELGTPVAPPNNSGFLNPTSEKHSKKHHEENGIHVDGVASSCISLNNETPVKMNKPTKVFSQSSLMDKGIHKDGRTVVEPQSIQDTGQKRLGNLLHESGGESKLKLRETGLISLAEMPSATKCSAKQESLSGTENSVGDFYQTGLKPKTRPKLLVKGLYFGRKHLFLASLSLHKKKKHKRSKKRCSSSRSMIKTKVPEDLSAVDCGTSTSESVRTLDPDSMQSPKKLSYSRSNNETDVGGVNDLKYCNGDVLHANDRDVRGNSKTSEQRKRSLSSAADQCDRRETDAYSKGSVQNGLVSLLMMGLKETTVPRWDDIELPSSQIHGLGDAWNRNIGYVPDEWDEEYDRGKRRKVKKAKYSFDGANPFQETANIKVRQKMKMKGDQTSSGNQPLRI